MPSKSESPTLFNQKDLFLHSNEDFPQLQTPISSPSPVIKQSSVRSSPNNARRYFDERLTSRLSALRTSPIKKENSIKESSSSSSILSTNIELSQTTTIQWIKMKKITTQISTREALIEQGDISCMTASDLYIAFGTSKGFILIFDYHQLLISKIKASNVTINNKITALSFSLDSTYLSAGYLNGLINIWDLNKLEPIISVPPITIHELQHNGENNHVGHLEGNAIAQLSFIGSRHTAIISSDYSGLILYHDGGRSLLGYYCRSKIMLGKYHLDMKTFDYSNTILGFSMLPIGSKRSNTDSMCILAVITPHVLLVLSSRPSFQTYLKISKPKVVDDTLGTTGLVCWFPATQSNTEKTENLPLLAYSWSNILTLYEVDSTKHKDEVGVESISLDFENKQRWVCSESIVSLQFLNSKILTVLTKSQKLIFLSRKGLNVLKVVDLLTKGIKWTQFFKGNRIGLIEQNYTNILKAFKSNILLLGKQEFIIGNLTNWADILMELIKNGDYIAALEECRKQYEGKCELALIGLPECDESRHKVVRSYLVEILNASLKYLFSEKSLNQINLLERRFTFEKFIKLAIQTCITIGAPPEMYEPLYETFSENNFEELFFQELENFILSSKLAVLPPIILKAMVKFYIAEDNYATLEQLICLLDIRQLDIDQTLSLCKANHLSDTLVYIWTVLLHDYITPLIDALVIIKKKFQDQSLVFMENTKIEDDASYVYPYMSYILTGRQYPTDKPVAYNEIYSAKLNIYYFLFNGTSISWPAGSPKFHIVDNYADEPAFPYLYCLLKYNSKNMFASLNEAFEDDLLNDDEIISYSRKEDKFQLKVNRQYIIDVLIGIFHDCDSNFSLTDSIRLSIFIARNYPKYQQFIKLAHSVLDETIETLCRAGNLQNTDGIDREFKENCELSLQSLLSVYRPIDLESIIMLVENAGFYSALLGLLKVENNFFELLKFWIKLKKRSLDNNNANPFLEEEESGSLGVNEIFESVPEMVKCCIIKGDSDKKDEIILLIKNNFELFIKEDPIGMANVISEYCETLNNQILTLKDGKAKFDYLRELFEIQARGKLNFVLAKPLRLAFVKSLKGDWIKMKEFVLGLKTVDSEIIDILSKGEDKELEILIDSYVRKGKYVLALNTIVDSINSYGSKIIHGGYDPNLEDSLWNCYNLGFHILECTDSSLSTIVINNLTLKESLLLQLVESSVNMFTDVHRHEIEEQNHDEKVLSLFKRLIQSAFTSVINMNKSNSDSFTRIFEEFLNRSSVKVTTLGDVRPVLKEIFLSYSHDNSILKLILKLVNDDIFDDLDNLEKLKHRGWSPVHLDCEVCGKRIWGSQIGNDIYESWQNHKMVQGNRIDSELEYGLRLYIFQCRHVYHTKCLENMGMVNDEDKCCILCTSV